MTNGEQIDVFLSSGDVKGNQQSVYEVFKQTHAAVIFTLRSTRKFRNIFSNDEHDYIFVYSKFFIIVKKCIFTGNRNIEYVEDLLLHLLKKESLCINLETTKAGRLRNYADTFPTIMKELV